MNPEPRLVLNLSYSTIKRPNAAQKRVDELTGWFMAQNFQHQIGSDFLKEYYNEIKANGSSSSL